MNQVWGFRLPTVRLFIALWLLMVENNDFQGIKCGLALPVVDEIRVWRRLSVHAYIYYGLIILMNGVLPIFYSASAAAAAIIGYCFTFSVGPGRRSAARVPDDARPNKIYSPERWPHCNVRPPLITLVLGRPVIISIALIDSSPGQDVEKHEISNQNHSF